MLIEGFLGVIFQGALFSLYDSFLSVQAVI